MLDASAEEGLGGGQATDFLCEDVQEFGLRVRAAVGQPGLEMIPHTFVGVQFRGVRRERLQVQPGAVAEQFLHRLAVMDPAIIQHHDEGAGNLPQQVPEEGRHFGALDVVFVQLAVEGAVTALRANRDARDGRDAVVRIPVPHDRGVAHRAPGLPHRGDQEEARFVGKDEMGAQPRGVFFTRGHASRFQRAMPASLRSAARRSGVWGLQPSWCRSLPT